MVRTRGGTAVAHDLARGVDSACETLSTAGEGPETCHRATFPKEGVQLGRGVVAPPHDLTCIVDGIGHAVCVPGKGPQVHDWEVRRRVRCNGEGHENGD